MHDKRFGRRFSAIRKNLREGPKRTPIRAKVNLNLTGLNLREKGKRCNTKSKFLVLKKFSNSDLDIGQTAKFSWIIFKQD